MSSIAANHTAPLLSGTRDSHHTILLVGAACAFGLLLATLEASSIVVIPAFACFLAILIKPEFGLYIFVVSLFMPVPHVGSFVIYPHDIAAVALIFSSFLHALARRDMELPPLYYLLPALALVAAKMLSLLNAQLFTAAATGVVQQFYMTVLVLWALFLLLRDEKVMRRALRLFMVMITLEALLIAAQFILSRTGNYTLIEIFAFDRHTFGSRQRVFGTIGPSVALLLAAAMILWFNSEKPYSVKLPFLMLSFFAILATCVRSAILGLAVAFIFYTVFTRRRNLSIKLIVPGIAGLALFVMIFGFSSFLDGLHHPSDSRFRLPMDRLALSRVPDHPFVGHGSKAASRLSIRSAGRIKVGVENEYAARIYENGIIGLSALLIFGSVPMLYGIRTMRRTLVPPAEGNDIQCEKLDAPVKPEDTHDARGERGRSETPDRPRLKLAMLAAACAAIVVGIYSAGPAGCIFEGAIGQWTVFFYACMLAATAGVVKR